MHLDTGSVGCVSALRHGRHFCGVCCRKSVVEAASIHFGWCLLDKINAASASIQCEGEFGANKNEPTAHMAPLRKAYHNGWPSKRRECTDVCSLRNTSYAAKICCKMLPESRAAVSSRLGPYFTLKPRLNFAPMNKALYLSAAAGWFFGCAPYAVS